jgi:protein SCO1/2
MNRMGFPTTAFLLASLIAAASPTRPASTSIADVPVRTHDDRPVHFYRDLVRDRVVAVNFVFTACTTVCPLMGVRFAKVQSLLGANDDRIALISISVDPVNDTPARLSEWSRKLDAKPGWTLVTGTKADIDTLVKSLGASTVDPASHVPLIVIIDDHGGGPWQRVDGLSDPADIARLLRERAASTAAP